jgi:hypothetical protein
LPDSRGLFTGRFDRCYVHSALYNIDPAVAAGGAGGGGAASGKSGKDAKAKSKGKTQSSTEGEGKNVPIVIPRTDSVVLAVRDTGGREMTIPIPNTENPSDHLPILTVVSWR